MNRLLRVVAFGGWLAHMLNQDRWWNTQNDKSTRPGLVVFWVAMSGLFAVIIGAQVVGAVGYGGQSRLPAAPGQVLAWTVIFVLLSALALLLAVGMAVGFVPFVTAKDGGAPLIGGMQPDESISVHTTGIVGFEHSRRRYRHRSGVLERHVEGELHLMVRRLGLAPTDPNGSWSTAAPARLTPSTVSKVRRGTAYLATEVRPAVKLTWKYGPVVLDFDDPDTRDRVYVELAGWSSRG